MSAEAGTVWAKAVSYTQNFFFMSKMLLLVLAGINMAYFHFVSGRDVAQWRAGEELPAAARLAGGLSLMIWVAVVACGRWIGFTIL